MKQILRKNGFGLLEILIAVFIVSLNLIYIFGIASYFVKSTENGYLTYQANLINETNLENIRALRDSSWTTNIAPLSIGTTYHTQVQSGTVSITTTDPGVLYQNFNSSFVLDSVYRDASSNIASSGTLDPDIKKVTSTTTWTFRGQNKSAQLIDYVANIKGN